MRPVALLHPHGQVPARDRPRKPAEPRLAVGAEPVPLAATPPPGGDDTFAPEATELSLDEYGFLEEPGFVPRFGGGGTGLAEDERGDI